MSEWINSDHEFDQPLASVEDFLRMAADDFPLVRSGVKVEMVTRAEKTQRDARRQHMLWGGLVSAMLFVGGLIWWPASSGSALASNQKSPQKPAASTRDTASDAVDWALVESKNELRRRNLEILRAAF